MRSYSILPDTGLFVVKGGQWVESDDPIALTGGVWQEAFEVDAQVGGTWKTGYLRPIPTTLTITSDPVSDKIAGIDQLSGSYTGTLVDALGRNVDGTLDYVFARASGTIVDTGTITVTNGVWSWSFDLGQATVDDIDEYTLSVIFADDPPLVGSSAVSPSFRVNSSSVTVTILTAPSGNLEAGYDSAYATGTAFREDASVAPGTVYVSWSIDNGTYSDESACPIDASGNWSYSGGEFGIGGVRRVRARYEPLPGGFEDPTEVFGPSCTVVPRAPSFTKGSVGETSIAMSTPGVLSVSGYEFYQGGTRRYSGTSKSYTRTGLSNYTQYNDWKVRSYKTSPGGTTYYSAFSSQHDARTGRPEKRDSGSRRIYVHCTGTGSYRRDVGWGRVGDKVRQGYYSSSYGGAGYFGLIDFGHLGIYNAIGNSIGSANRDAASCTGFLLGTYRESGVGAWSSNRTATATSSDSAVNSGGDPSGQWQATNFTMQPVGSFRWHNLGARFGEEFLTYRHRSICIRRHNSGDYLGINGRSSGSADCDVQIDVSWNRVTQTKINGTWLN